MTIESNADLFNEKTESKQDVFHIRLLLRRIIEEMGQMKDFSSQEIEFMVLLKF